jgi:hypothetical protein
MNGRMTKEARALEIARFAICDFHEEVGKVMLALEKVREAGLAEPHHLVITEGALSTDQVDVEPLLELASPNGLELTDAYLPPITLRVEMGSGGPEAGLS